MSSATANGNGAENGVGAKPQYREIPLAEVHESKFNTRKTWTKDGHAKLVASLRVHGQLTPGVGRVDPRGGIELAAGARRLRALTEVQAATMNVIVRPMTDAELIEIIVIENDQREDVHPLEEARGYAELMRKAIGYDVAKIAGRVGRSHDYVYDRLRLLQLTPLAQTLFLGNKFSLAHAIELARLTPEHQARAIDIGGAHGPGNSEGLFTIDYSLFDEPADGGKRDPYARVKACSVGEFRKWITTHVRFDVAAAIVPDLWPETSGAVTAATQRGDKIVQITRLYRAPDDAKDPDGGRTIGEVNWKRADGREESKVCEHAVLGVVAVGPGYGEAFNVCISKDKCALHWRAERAKAERRRKDRQRAASGDSSAAKREDARAAKEKDDRAKRDALTKRARKAAPLLRVWLSEQVRAMSPSAIAKLVLANDNLFARADLKAGGFAVTAASAPEDILRAIVFFDIESVIPRHDDDQLSQWELKRWTNIGLDFIGALDSVSPEVEKSPKVALKPPPQKKSPRGVPRSAKKQRKLRDFMAPMQPDAVLAAVVGDAPLARTELTKKIWAYIKKNGLQDEKNRRMINTDARLSAVIGGPQVNMFQMTQRIAKHLTPVRAA